MNRDMGTLQAYFNGLDVCWPRGSLNFSRRVYIMGIVNVTPDSFSDGGAYPTADAAVEAALRMVEEGADIIDIGGESTRPGAEPVDVKEELARVIPVVERLRARSSIPISIDTRKSAVAKEAIAAGADIINDVSALQNDPGMGDVAASAHAPVILMHMKGEPRTMQLNPHYDDLIGEVRTFFEEAITRAERAGIPRAKIILDPGIGFGKTVEHNLKLINHLGEFAALGRPIAIGASRKSFIGKVLGLDVHDRLEGTLAVTALAVARGARLLRVHDVKANVRAARMAEAILSA